MITRWWMHEATFDPLLRPYRERADRVMVGMNVFLFIVCFLAAFHRTTFLALFLIGVPTVALALVFARTRPGALSTRLFMGCSFMAFTGLLIHQTGGDIEAHFAAFGLIGILLYYRDWRTIFAATTFIYFHHLILGYAQILGAPIYVFDAPEFWTLFFLHVAYFLPFVGMMGYLAIWLRREGHESQHVIDIAQQIVQGNLIDSTVEGLSAQQSTLIHSVLQMKARLLDLLRVIPVAAAVIRIDLEQVVNVNEAWVKTLGPLEEQGLRFGQSPIWAEPETWQLLLARLHEASETLLDKVEVVLRRTDGTPVLCEISLILHDEMVPVMAILTVEDITLRRKTEQTMQRLAFSDLLTDLPNRARFHTAFEVALLSWKNQQEPFAFVMMDLDGFKPINDTYGHDAGDEVLRVVAARFRQIKGPGDLVARVGGDEFSILLCRCPTREAAYALAQAYVASVSTPIPLSGASCTVQIGASAGVVHVHDGFPATEIQKKADEALYRAKEKGKNRVEASLPYSEGTQKQKVDKHPSHTPARGEGN